jgi:hypothetical protein
VRPSRLSFKASATALLAASLGVAALAGCGSPGQSAGEECGLCGDMGDVYGAISNKSGSQTAMKGYAIASIERDTGIARVADINEAGLFTLRNVRSDQAQTLALFSSTYLLQAVLSMPGTAPNNIKQFIMMSSASLPQLVNNGPTITFQSLAGITVTKDLASDAYGDGAPDGAAHIQGLGLTQAPPQDSDLDGIYNDKDPDIDGDGVVNWLDPDDDGDKTRDAFDPDANSDLSADNQPGETDTDLYFKEGVEYISVQYEQTPQDDGTTTTTLKFLTKVRDNVTPRTVQVRGAPSLLNTATFSAKDPTSGAMIDQPWTRLLDDDGVSDDGNPGDRVFAKRVKLPDGQAPSSYQAVFFQLGFGTDAEPWFIEYPYLFPDVKPSAISAIYDTLTRTVQLQGTPFGATVQDFVWIINLYDDAGQIVWNSQAVQGSTREFAIPENQIEAGKTYKFEVVAQSLDKIPGHPSYVTHTLNTALQ